MAKKNKPVRAVAAAEPVKVSLPSALLDKELESWLRDTELRYVHLCFHRLRTTLYWWMGQVSAERLDHLYEDLPWLNIFTERNIVYSRLNHLEDFARVADPKTEALLGEPEREKFYGVRLDSLFPELKAIGDAIVKHIESSSLSRTSKAESWLYAIANNINTDADWEAAVYLASRSLPNISREEVEESWYNSICYQIEQEHNLLGKKPEAYIKQLAIERKLTLKQAADALRDNDGDIPFFRTFRDEEEDFVDAALLRTSQWLNIWGYDEWWRSATAELSSGPIDGIDFYSSPYKLFFWCRSDLALSLAAKEGLQAWIWGLQKRNGDRNNPWMLWARNTDIPRKSDLILTAAAIAFCVKRIAPQDQSPAITDEACRLLMQSQLRSGGWPFWSDKVEPEIVPTCVAIHALAVCRPLNWQEVAIKGAEWLLSQQDSWGLWNIQGGPTVMLTVLALDSIDLAHGKTKVTFNIQPNTPETLFFPEGTTQIKVKKNYPKYDFTGQHWHNPKFPKLVNVAYNSLNDNNIIDIIIITATITELKQVFHLLDPLPSYEGIVKVTYQTDTYYLGLFGAFRAIVLRSDMGESGVQGATLASERAIKLWSPQAIIMIGIAFGADFEKHKPADVLVSKDIAPYELQRVGKDDEIVLRSSMPPSGPTLLNRFENALGWEFVRPDNSKVDVHPGRILSGSKLIDNEEFKKKLLVKVPTAIGGEMEGVGIWAAAASNKVEWIVIKSVCDWADGDKDDTLQEMAAASACSLCHFVLSDPNALEGLDKKK